MLCCRKEGAGAGPTAWTDSIEAFFDSACTCVHSWQVPNLSGAVGAGTLFARVFEAVMASSHAMPLSFLLSEALTAPANAVDDPLAHGAPGATALENHGSLWHPRAFDTARSIWLVCQTLVTVFRLGASYCKFGSRRKPEYTSPYGSCGCWL